MPFCNERAENVLKPWENGGNSPLKYSAFGEAEFSVVQQSNLSSLEALWRSESVDAALRCRPRLLQRRWVQLRGGRRRAEKEMRRCRFSFVAVSLFLLIQQENSNASDFAQGGHKFWNGQTARSFSISENLMKFKICLTDTGQRCKNLITINVTTSWKRMLLKRVTLEMTNGGGHRWNASAIFSSIWKN